MALKLLQWLMFIAILVIISGWWITRPDGIDATRFAALDGDETQGKAVFWAGGCASCHAAPDAEGDARLVLSGGRRFPSPFGTFIAPNISPDPEHGIGGWSVTDLASAMMAGVSPEGSHYYPAFPYASYTRSQPQDVADLHAYLATLPASATPNLPHEVRFPFNMRRSLGGWKWLFVRENWVIDGDLTPSEERGRYLVEGLGHCGECHTPRNALGGLEFDRWLAGAPDPSGKGRVPNITPAALDWSERDIAAYLETGFTPEYDSAGGHMAEVVVNFAELSSDDRNAVAAYLKRVPPVE